MRYITKIAFVIFFVTCQLLFSQNEQNKWYFGTLAGLDFMTSPPTILTNGSVNTIEGCASIANGAGNLLFYTDGVTVYDQTHAQMANGNGLAGNTSPCQSSVILKKPGSSTLYYIFTIAGIGLPPGLNYSIVDMSLASGQGSVTVKNSPLYTLGCYEKITGTRHCNGVDYWIISHDLSSSVFRAFLLSSTGVNTAAVTSTIGTAIGAPYSLGCMKMSPNGQKLGMTDYQGYVDLFDFNPTTGILTNSLSLITGFGSYGCEFSPDGTKFYAGSFGGTQIKQWDLCAGSGTAIVASVYSIPAINPFSMQTASNGKIYVAQSGNSLGVINNPNLSGALCNYVSAGQSISPRTTSRSLPNFISFGYHPTPVPFTHTVSNAFGCQTASYTAPPIVQNFTMVGCAASGYSLVGIQWNFGDPLSGSANTSTVVNPSHGFTTLGTYTTQLIVYYSCGGGTDTIRQVVNINQPCIVVNSTSITCANLGSATVQATGGIGPYSYTWMPGSQSGSVATGLSPGTYTLTVFDFGNNFTYTATTNFTSLIPLTGNMNTTTSLSCNGVATGTANFTNIAGGSGTQTYLWSNGTNNYTSASPNNLVAGNYTVTVTDGLTGCTINNGFFITQPPPLVLTLAASVPSICAGASVALTSTVSGGSPIPVIGYNYTWTAGPQNFSYTPATNIAGNKTYTLTAQDSYGCEITETVAVLIVANPTVSFSSSLICPLQTGTLTAIGATSYTWNGFFTGNVFTANPAATTIYTVVGAIADCSASATGSIILKPLPVPILTTNGPRCNGDKLLLNASGGVSYSWSGPLAFSSAIQNPTINPVGLTNAGVYNVTVTAANACTASISSANVVVNVTPTLSASGSTVCTAQTISLSSSAAFGSVYSWSGPLSFSSLLQNPTIVNAGPNHIGNYTVKVTSANGCTNTASRLVSILSPPVPILALSNSTICAHDFNGSNNTIFASGSGAVTYTIITPAGVLNGTPSGPTSMLTSVAPFISGPVTITLTGSNGVCAVSITKSFAIVSNPIVAINATAPVICANEIFTYSVQGAGSYTWSPASAGLWTNGIGSVAVVTPPNSTIYSVFGTSLGCNSATQNSNLTVNPLPVIVINPQFNAICLNSSIQLQVTGSGTSYSWSPSTGLNTTTGNSVIASPVTQQFYTVTSSLNSCTATALITVSVLALPIPGLSLSKSPVCLNDVVTFQGFGGNTYSWKNPLGFVKTGQTLLFTVDNMGYAGNHVLTVTDQMGCSQSTVFPLVVNDLPKGTLSGTKMQGCVPFCSDFNFNSPGYLASWRVNGQSVTGNTFSACFYNPDDYMIFGDLRDSSTNCTNTQTFVVNAWPVPVVDFVFYPPNPIENIDEVVFTGTSTAGPLKKWNWFFIDNKGRQTNLESPTYLFQEEGTYTVALVGTNQFGCADSVTKSITVETDFSVYVPTAFTPNDDGLNELFKPVMRGAKSFTFTIFNRWGQKLYETSDFNGGWNGTFKGDPCKADSYVWRLDVQSANTSLFKTGKQEQNLSGQVTLYR